MFPSRNRCLVAPIALVLCAAQGQPSRAAEDVRNAAVAEAAGQEIDGRRLFLRNCARCHGPSADGGAGGDIRGATMRKVHYALRGVERMPAFEFSDDQEAALHAYLTELSGD